MKTYIHIIKKGKVEFKKEVKKEGRLYCPICGIDITIVKTHEPCSWTISNEKIEFSKPIRLVEKK